MKKLKIVLMLTIGLLTSLFLISCDQLTTNVEGDWIINLSGMTSFKSLEVTIENHFGKVIAKDSNRNVVLKGKKNFNSIELSGVLDGQIYKLSGSVEDNIMFGTFSADNDKGEWIGQRNEGELTIMVE